MQNDNTFLITIRNFCLGLLAGFLIICCLTGFEDIAIRKLFGGEISPEGQIMFDLVKILVMVGVLVALLVGRCLHDRKRKRVREQVLGELAKLQE